jgi:hypothetical protein
MARVTLDVTDISDSALQADLKNFGIKFVGEVKDREFGSFTFSGEREALNTVIRQHWGEDHLELLNFMEDTERLSLRFHLYSCLPPGGDSTVVGIEDWYHRRLTEKNDSCRLWKVEDFFPDETTEIQKIGEIDIAGDMTAVINFRQFFRLAN